MKLIFTDKFDCSYHVNYDSYNTWRHQFDMSRNQCIKVSYYMFDEEYFPIYPLEVPENNNWRRGRITKDDKTYFNIGEMVSFTTS